MPADAEISPLNLSISASSDKVITGNNILISFSSSGKSNGIGGDIVISSGPLQPGAGPCPQGTYIAIGPETVIQGITIQILSLNYIPEPGWAEVKLNGTKYDIKIGESIQTPIGMITLLQLQEMGACFILPGIVPPVTPPGSPPVGGVLPLPALESCILPELSWNFTEVVRQAVVYVSCNLQNLVTLVSWLISALATLIPQLIEGLTYFLSLGWITDWIQGFFTQLDIWVSNKFGIDPNLPFFEELIRKALEWISGAIDAAAENRMKIRGWK